MSDNRGPLINRLEGSWDRLIKAMNAAAQAQLAFTPGTQLSSSQRIILRHLINHGPCPVSEVANQLGVTLSAATGLVDRLVKAKMVTRDRDQTDRRVVWVKITPDGEAAVFGAETRRHAAFGAVTKDLSDDELARLLDLLDRMG